MTLKMCLARSNLMKPQLARCSNSMMVTCAIGLQYMKKLQERMQGLCLWITAVLLIWCSATSFLRDKDQDNPKMQMHV